MHPATSAAIKASTTGGTAAFSVRGIVGASSGLREVLRQVETVAATDATVLIEGETGTGKEVIANAIHDQSPRRSRRIVKVNSAAIPSTLLESELFGHERGAFTGAVARRIGRFEMANDGTLFLDEIGELPLELQPKLLRLLQEREYERLGGSETRLSNARLVVATNRKLKEMVEAGKFREDLYYRLNVFPIRLPPLRERREDIPLLARSFAEACAKKLGKSVPPITPSTMVRLTNYAWPGNIRELENTIERGVILWAGVGSLEVDLPEPVHVQVGAPSSADVRSLADVQRAHILAVLESTGWVIGGPRGAAAKLGMKRSTLNFRIKKLGISPSPGRDGWRMRSA
jgi:formate hydrogenlyase transcriptional activator